LHQLVFRYALKNYFAGLNALFCFKPAKPLCPKNSKNTFRFKITGAGFRIITFAAGYLNNPTKLVLLIRGKFFQNNQTSFFIRKSPENRITMNKTIKRALVF